MRALQHHTTIAHLASRSTSSSICRALLTPTGLECKLNWNGEWQERGKLGQPLPFLLGLPDRPIDARQSHDHIGAQPIERVVCACGGYRREWEAGPLRICAASSRATRSTLVSTSSTCLFPALMETFRETNQTQQKRHPQP